ncbi:Ubiquitin thioesterase OTUB1-like protein [Penicillium ucsense]|uniref:ubiquitinyl hydrolase 1 n=1 Tax=Penicillium ucsense TaxID=2839758 RepID=A0A8J8VZF0_9EURO|nr:Ubiquitin thioesterase OTUB1-like protein [Penicillium ucsense]KAF7734520.1 Ubiquitin thioesterase OTUB1-like protein [Penicillium ucsense]
MSRQANCGHTSAVFSLVVKFPGCYQDALAPPAFFRSLGLPNLAALEPVSFIMSNSSNMNALSADEMERFQKLSNDFEPEAPGLLVSAKQSSQSIAMEYANADPTFATKTNALAITHPMTRVMKRDGNCGWRAMAFGYFETLFSFRDLLRVEQERIRIKSLNYTLDQVGYPEHLYEMFTDATDEVFAQISTAIQNSDPDESFLVNAFNDEYNSNSIVMHFRLLTGAWMKLNRAQYEPFLEPIPLDQYCATEIDTVRSEIDQVGLQALTDGVISNAGFGVEVLYLDRSRGDAVTPHQFTQNCPSDATIRLLYRPGHYDIIYRAEQTVNVAPVVNFQYAMTSDYVSWDQGALSFDANPHLMAIPNLMADPAFAMGGAPMSPVSSVSPSPASPYRLSPTQEMYPSPMQSNAIIPSIPVSSPTPSLPSAAPPPMTSLPSRSNDGPQIRLNPLVMRPSLNHLPVTAPFKNSPYNQAHFRNQDFEPIHWAPNESRK